MHMFRRRGLAFASAVLPVLLSAQNVPSTINYQGRLTDNGSTPAPITATVNMRFEIWDVASGGVAGTDRLWVEPASGTIPVSVTGGIFNVLLGNNGVPVPATLFITGPTRYLQIIANGETLGPRQAIGAAAYANQAQAAASAADSAALGGVAASGWQKATTQTCAAGSFVQSVAPSGATTCAAPSGTLTPPVAINGSLAGDLLDVTNGGGGIGAYIVNNSATGSAPALSVFTNTPAGAVASLYNYDTGASGDGLYAFIRGSGSAVDAQTSGSGVAVNAQTTGGGHAVTAITSGNRAVYARGGNGSGSGLGYFGAVVGDGENGYGVVGISKTASAGVFRVQNAASIAPAVDALSDGSGSVVVGTSNTTTAIGIGVAGNSNSGFGGSAGVRGAASDGAGVIALSTNGVGLSASSTNSDGVYAYTSSSTSVALYANNIPQSNSGSLGGTYYGAEGVCNTSGCNGLYAQANSTTGGSSAVYARNFSTGGFGVYANTDGGGAVAGIYGTSGSSSGNGVIGEANGGSGAYGVWGKSTAGYAGYFSGKVTVSGNLTVTGTVSKGGGSFKIDHPLDPENKYLYHSFVESPDMMNLYNGNVTTDARGYAEITLPDWFEALNRDFRYQLTVLGEEFAQAIVTKKIAGNRFTIRTSRPRVEVSWLVTGIRKDDFANAHRIPVEEEKPEGERGRYLYPAERGAPAASGIAAARESEKAPASER